MTQKFLQLISNNFPDMLWAKDLHGDYIFANKAICENLLMATTDEVVGKNDLFFATREREKHKDNPQWHTFGELCYNSDIIVLEQMKEMEFEEYGNIKGELTYLNVHKSPLFNEEGKLIGTIGSGRDITTQKKLESEISTTTRLINSGPLVVFEWNPDAGWPIRSVSQNVKDVLGISYKELMNHSVKFSDFIHPHDIDTVSQEVGEYIASKTESFVQEYRVVRDDGFLWVRDYTVIKYTEDGLPSIIKGYLLDNTAEVESQEKMLKIINTDMLTMLPNRHQLQNDLENSSAFGCVVFNIDKFREINDLFGIKIGDSILIQFSKWFKNINLDVYRIGGDEFAMIIKNKISWNELQLDIEQWLEELSHTLFHLEKESISIRMNVGVALNSKKLLTQADIALHHAKVAKASYYLYKVSENIEEIYRKNIAMTESIHEAIASNRLVCYYQPIVQNATGKIVKYETLVRMIDESGTVIPPISFLPIAKKTKLYPKITRIVIDQACAVFQHRTEEFSVNLSIDDIEDVHTLQHIIKTIIKTDTASRIVFEILESEGIENYDDVQSFIKQVKSLGAKIAIDDFGTGYSNFEHILKLNIDYIKIDGSLIKNITTNDRHRIIVETIVDFSQKIGTQTIAEFVSEKEILEKVKSLNVDFS